ncbi:hypothetical protein RHSIM_RhsimUnG0062600 [Rhododendron simsii]|uniref:Transmembrane protein n=1 Tax=Rhododendron simsii TaxID=118357 RepID=A0A834FWE8_RHOSS|nr:hypothetical protein RHSIM_RhsimUnG0062600 [Rhododendron simsii]
MISLMILVIIVPLISPPKPDNPSSESTHINGADGLTTDPDPTLIPARDLMMASSSLTRNSSETRNRASDSGSTELSGGYSDGDRAMMSSQNPNVPESPPPVSAPTVGVQEPVQTTTTTRGDTTASSTTTLFLKGKIFLIYIWKQITKIKRILDMMHSAATAASSTTGPFNLGNKSLILAFEAALALINIRFQALGNSSSATLLSSFLVTMLAATTVFAFTATLIGLMLEGVHQAVATVCSYAGLISVVLAFIFTAATFIPERFVWLVWADCVVLALVFVYTIAKRTCNTSAASSTPSSV